MFLCVCLNKVIIVIIQDNVIYLNLCILYIVILFQFLGCVEVNKIDTVFKLPLNLAEEEAFMTFLEKTTHPQADDLRVLYLLSRSRYGH